MGRSNRREFLADVGSGMLVASLGATLAADMGLAPAVGAESSSRLTFGNLEPLVALMQDSSPDQLMKQLVDRLKSGTDLQTLVAAGALANARSFGGQDYIGYHSFMALAPAFDMAKQLPEPMKPLPVLKVLYRNTERIQAVGGAKNEILHEVDPGEVPSDRDGGVVLQELSRKFDMEGAERTFAAMAKGPIGEAYQHLQFEVQDEIDVHRVVLSWRAWAMRELAGEEHGHTLLRQSLRYCVDVERKRAEKKYVVSNVRQELPRLFDQYKLLEKPFGTRVADDAWIESFARTIYSAPRERAADAVAAALAEGISPDSISESLVLAANMLVLHDIGRTKPWTDKPIGSVHGDSVGVHASDAANAWRNIAQVSNHRNRAASLIVGAYHTAGQSASLHKDPYPLADHLSKISANTPASLLAELNTAIRAKDQQAACAIATKYGQLGGEPRPIFDLLLQFATSEDGALHAEKYYRTVHEEFARTRPAFRWRQVAALARVTASEYGKTAAGYARAKELLRLA